MPIGCIDLLMLVGAPGAGIKSLKHAIEGWIGKTAEAEQERLRLRQRSSRVKEPKAPAPVVKK